MDHRSHSASLFGGILASLVLVLLVVSGLWVSAYASPGTPYSLRGDSAFGPSRAPSPLGSVVSGTLEVGGGLENLTPEFWAVNYNYQTGASGFDNRSVASLLNETPITWIRYPLVDTSYQNSATWQALAQFCDSVHCHSIATVGGPGITAQDAANDVARAESLGIHPDYWVLGNEPNLWPGETPIEYANLVLAWIGLVHASDPSAKFLGAEISGNPRVGSDYIYNVTKVDGPYIQGLAIQVYPQVGGSTLADFLAALTAGASVQNAILNARTLMASACPSCSIPLLLNEVNGGSGFNTNYIPYREQFADATFLAASIIQGLRLGLVQFAPWTLTAASDTTANGTNHCDFGMIQLLPGCDGEFLQPTFSLYQNLLTQLPFGTLTNVSFPGAPDFYGLESTNGTNRSLLVVNADPSETENFTLGGGFPTGGTVLTYLMDPGHVSTPLVDMAQTSSVFSLPPTGVMVLRFSPAPQVGITASPAELALGNPTQIQTLVDGASGILTYSYSDLPPGCSNANLSEFSCTPTEVGSFPTTVVVTQGNRTVGSANTDVTVTSSVVTHDPTFYPLTFAETGLPTGAPWTVVVNGTVLSTNNTTQGTVLLNGTYAFTVTPVSQFVANPDSGEFNVTGAAQLVVVGFSAAGGPPPGGTNNSTSAPFAVTFEVAGLASSPNWTLSLDGVGYAVDVTNITVQLSVGTHSFGANASGYSADPAQGIVVSTGSSYQQAIDFTPLPVRPAGPGSSGTPSDLLGVLLSPLLLGVLCIVGAAASGGPYARRVLRRRGYARWFEEERLRASADRSADVARELASVPALFQQWTATPRTGGGRFAAK